MRDSVNNRGSFFNVALDVC